jgi:hypothetical protein
VAETTRKNTDARPRVGAAHSSDEAPVTGGERRGSGIVYSAAGQTGRDSEGKGRHEKAGHSDRIGSHCADRGQACHRTDS